MEKWRYWLRKPGAGKWLRAGSVLIIAGMLFTVLIITSGVLAAPHHEQQTDQEASGKSTSLFKQQIVISPIYTLHKGTKNSAVSCPSNTILTGGGYRLVKGSSECNLHC